MQMDEVLAARNAEIELLEENYEKHIALAKAHRKKANEIKKARETLASLHTKDLFEEPKDGMV